MTEAQIDAAVVDGVAIDAVHAAASACRGVARIGSGSLAALTTYLPGRRVPGIRVNPDSVELEVVAEWGATAAELGRDISAAVSPLIGGRRLDISIADILLPGEQLAQDRALTQPSNPPER